jgi:alpha-beta hydrolase superfamily lysophospholipase
MPAAGLRFDALPAVDARSLPPLERFRARDGAQLPLRHFAADADCALILLHGSGHHGRYLAPLAARLAGQRTARVCVPDLRGHGEAPARRGDLDYADQLEDDLADLVAWLRERHRPARIAIAGHSSGGGLALRFAGGGYGEQAAGYALLAPYLGHAAPTTRPGSGGWARAHVPRIVLLSLLGALGIHALDGLTTVRFALPEALRDGTETLAYSWRMTQGFAPRDWGRDLAALRRPLLLLVGGDDEAFLAQRYADVVPARAPAAQVEILPGLSHLGIAGAPETAARLTAWLSALKPL